MRIALLLLLRSRRVVAAIGLVFRFILLSQPSLAATFTVNTTGDDSDNSPGDGVCFTGLFADVGGGVFAPACTLRAAIRESNALAGADVVEFAASLPKVAGVVEINLDHTLPSIQDQITIDGYSADGYDLNDPNESPIINISGSALSPVWLSNGIEIIDGSSGSRIQGLALYNFATGGIVAGAAQEALSNLTIEGCHIGISRGVFYQGNGDEGIYLRNTRNATIGRTCNETGCTGQRNVIASNNGAGILLDRARYTSVAGNLIGTNTSGSSTFVPFGGATPNQGWGIDAISGRDNQIGARAPGGGNLISGNTQGGIRIDEPGTTVYNNKVGTNLAGTAALPNLGPGIELATGPNTVGSVGQGRNLVSGNDGAGIDSNGPNLIVGNTIGLSDDQSTPLGNANSGVLLNGSGALVRANVIGGNTLHGVLAFGDSHSIILNRVGTNLANEDVGNTFHGIVVSNTDGVEIGGAGVGNIIGYNNYGIGVSFVNSNNAIEGNFIGTSPEGVDIGNEGTGIHVSNSSGTTIGGIDGLDNGLANAINFNGGYGVSLGGPSSARNSTRIIGNYIGTNAMDDPMGNALGGVSSRGQNYIVGAPRDEVPENVAPYGNRIAHNAGPAIAASEFSLDSTFRGNEIYQNAGGATPIDLGQDGPTANDVGDIDEGSNRFQNSPEFLVNQTAWNELSGDLEVRYRVNTNEGDAAYPLTVDFYLLNEIGGFADVYLGSDIYPDTSATLYRSVAITPPAGLDVTGMLLATVTDADGNTSEFSRQSVPVPEPSFAWSLILGATVLTTFRRKKAGGSDTALLRSPRCRFYAARRSRRAIERRSEGSRRAERSIDASGSAFASASSNSPGSSLETSLPFTRSRTTSPTAGASSTTTGTPAAIASVRTTPWVSVIEANTNTSMP